MAAELLELALVMVVRCCEHWKDGFGGVGFSEQNLVCERENWPRPSPVQWKELARRCKRG